ncbi:putative ferric-chelate reductase 1 precursor [Danio rerio]|uniref:Ferric-chelate reductase 1 n=1 Tax=Danio rerio TaxID=7955 RepID=E7FGT6_DANRE|nr:putative ferric-chelate reductase 1 precursor [Danio rerio]|eukprot:XP_017209505.1 putative ferric-chelate reductase 1 [Danio rerio]
MDGVCKSPQRLLFILVLCVGLVQSYKNGLVSEVCDSMMPNHGANAQTSSPPFTVTADKTTFKEGDQIKVTLNSQTGYYFEGFMLQARPVGSSSTIGTFSVTGNNVQVLSCNGMPGRAVSHTSNAKTTSVQVTWTAPTSGQLGNIEFSVTFVKSTLTFWVQVKSSAIVYNGTITTTNTTTVAPTVASIPGCGSTKVCFSEPNNCNPTTSNGCYFVAVQTSSDQSEMKIEMFGQADGYVAIGFSDDKEMGNDDVYICGKDNNGNLQVQHAFNSGKSSPAILSLGNVSNIMTALTNGKINCSFTSRNTISTASRAASNNEYHLMIAAGSSNEGKIQFHTNKYVSSTKANLLNPSVVITSEEEFPPIVKAHGCLMLISWMATGSIGMIIARYLKGVAKGQGCCGKDFWFVAHVSLMTLSVIATAIAFIIVFVSAGDWVGGAHPVLGCLVMILSLIQPIVAAFRCEPQHERRFVFNWAHSCNAFAIKCLAVAAIFTGLALFEEYDSDGWMLKVMGGYLAWEALMYILQDLNLRAKKKDSQLCSCEPMSSETILLFVFIIGNLAFLIALLVGIGSA